MLSVLQPFSPVPPAGEGVTDKGNKTGPHCRGTGGCEARTRLGTPFWARGIVAAHLQVNTSE